MLAVARFSCFIAAGLCLAAGSKTSAQAPQAAGPIENKPIEGIGPTGPVTKLHVGFQYTEGPAADRLGNLFFSDIPGNRIHKVDSAGKLSTYIEPSNHTNGLMVDARGELVACEMDGRIVAYAPRTGDSAAAPRVITAEHNGARYNAPNDLVIDRAGGVYFTDPHFRAPMPLPQGKTGVYYVDAAGKATRLIDDLQAPNGVILSPDEKTLYVIPSQQSEIMAYPVEGPGKIGAGRVLAQMKQPEGQTGRGGDGLTVDTAGNLYIATGLGLQVVSPKGEHLGIIKLPEGPANVTFAGPENRTLYVTARTGLYTVPMQAAGHVFAAPAK
jgi:gluconolactonase